MKKILVGFVVTLLMTTYCYTAFAKDRDNNPPGKAGGRGTNWENKPGLQGGPGVGPDKRMPKGFGMGEKKGWGGENMPPGLRKDRDNNPPGPQGGQGTNWENKPGPRGGAGASPNRPHPKR